MGRKEIRKKVSYKDGFFELPYLVNSPQAMVESFKKLPFVKNNTSKQTISAKTPFLDIMVCYGEVEKELFLLYSKAKFNSNVCFRHVYDTSSDSDYYCLSLRIDHYAKINNSLANGISYTDNSWLLFKPGAKVNHHHFKGTKGQYFSVYFTLRWLKYYMKKIPLKQKQVLSLFLKSGSDHLISPNLPGIGMYGIERLREALLLGRMDKNHINKLKKEIYDFIRFFISRLESENINKNHFNVSNQERIKVLTTDRIIKKYAFKKFPGIEFIAKEVGFSETKLKECFKIVYGKTLFQYFRDVQLEKAKQMILSTDRDIRQIAQELGYENASKFTAAFKTHYSVLPSQIKRLKFKR